jgi:hypothetical protein
MQFDYDLAAMTSPEKSGPLPFMKSIEDAVALCEKEQDTFYVTAFMIEAWLGGLTLCTAAEYAEKKSASDRRLQSGEAARLFQETFGQPGDEGFSHLYQCLLRFAQYDDAQSEMLLRAFLALSIESPVEQFPPLNPEYVRKHTQDILKFVRDRVARLCEWLEAVSHWETHLHYHLSPLSFDPDPEKRELAILGISQRCFPRLSDFSKEWWQWHHGEAAERFKDSPKWPTVGKAMGTAKTRRHKHPELDDVVICLWPLLKRHNWTYRDLLNVVMAIVPQHDAYPFDREHDLATYCNNVLGLRKQGEGSTATDGKPPGFDVALRLCGRNPS